MREALVRLVVGLVLQVFGWLCVIAAGYGIFRAFVGDPVLMELRLATSAMFVFLGVVCLFIGNRIAPSKFTADEFHPPEST
jgi:hypothetical protein